MKIFTACALGAGIGAFIALSLNEYIWWLGMLIGGLIGYISYEFKQVVRAMSVAWKYANQAVSTKSFWLGCAKVFLIFLIGASIVASFTAIFAIPHAFVTISSSSNPGWPWYHLLDFGILMGSVIGGWFVLGLLSELLNSEYNAFLSARYLVRILFWVSPPGVIVALALGTKLFITKSPLIAKFCAVFVKKLFLLIHSDERLLCGVDAAIGAGVGYFLGNALVGALVGGVVGVLNYEILSRRVLRVAPRR